MAPHGFVSFSEIGYLESFNISELMTYLKTEYRSTNFKKVEKILNSKEEKMRKDLEFCRTKCTELSIVLKQKKKENIGYEGKLEELELDKVATQVELKECKEKATKDLEMYKAKYSRLPILLNKMKTEIVEIKGRLEEMALNKIATANGCEKYKVKAAEYLEMYKAKCSELLFVLEEKRQESIEFKGKLEKVELDKITTANELKEYKVNAAKDLKMFKAKFSELLIALEEKKQERIRFEGKLKELELNNIATEAKLNKIETEARLSKFAAEAKLKDYKAQAANHLQLCTGKCSALLIALREKKKESIEYERKLKELELDNNATAAVLKEGKVKAAKDIEMYTIKCSTLSTALEGKKQESIEFEGRFEQSELSKNAIATELKEYKARVTKDMEMYKAKCLVLSTALEEMKRENVRFQGRYVELELNKLATEAELSAYKVRVTEELEMYKANCSALLTALDEKKQEIIEFESKLEELELNKSTTASELKEYKVKAMKDLEMYKAKCSVLSTALEEMKRENVRFQGRSVELEFNKIATEAEINAYKVKVAEELEMYKAKCSALLTALEEKKQESIEVESRLEKLELNKSITASELKEYKVKATKDLEMYKDRCSHLSVALEEKKKESVGLKDELEELKLNKISTEAELNEYKMSCNKLKEKVMHIEEDCKHIGEREKRAVERIIFLLDELAETNKDKGEELEKLNTEYRDLKCAKRRAVEEIEVRKKRYKVLETRITKLAKELSGSIFSEQVSKTSLELKVGTEVSDQNEKNNESRQSVTNGGLFGVCSSKLKIDEKTKSSNGDIHDSTNITCKVGAGEQDEASLCGDHLLGKSATCAPQLQVAAAATFDFANKVVDHKFKGTPVMGVSQVTPGRKLYRTRRACRSLHSAQYLSIP